MGWSSAEKPFSFSLCALTWSSDLQAYSMITVIRIRRKEKGLQTF